MLDRLVGRAVLAEPDGIMGHDIDDALTHQRRKPDGRPAVIGAHQEGDADWHHALVQGEAVHRRGHAVPAHAVMDRASGDTARSYRPLPRALSEDLST